ncbi:MAG TPA: efflux RND transporter permease subunit [Nannocystaceae bacterium]|nr:efflux RND transporter permease subunit [Nannocystaceae bacterium]
MQWLAEICIKRPIFATVLVLLICVVGAVGYSRLGVDRFPKIDFPSVTITTRLPGSAPEDIESEITDRIERAVNTASGIEELRSASAEGVSQVFVQFKLERDIDVAAQDVRDRVDSVLSELPLGIEPPVVTKVDPDAAPILYIAVSGEGRSVRDITAFADHKVRRDLESISGVGAVRVIGGNERQINVWLDPVRMRAYGITAPEVSRVIANENITMPGGRVDTGPDFLTLRIHGRVDDPHQLENLVVRQGDGHIVRLRDFAHVEDGAEEVETAARYNGKPSVVLSMRKQSGENTVAVVDAVKARIAELEPELPPGYRLDVLRDESQTIRTSTHAVSEHLVVGAGLAALVVLLFLGNLRSTVIAAVAIPTSIVGTFAVMWMQGFTLNTMTLLALALSVGIVIDDAIVVLENIFKQVEEHGVDPRTAAIEGTKEIGLAVLATTFSLIAVFLPVAFVAGIPGRFLASFGLTMVFAISVSLFVSFTLTPMMASRWLKQVPHGTHRKKSWLERLVDVFYRPIERVYMVVLRFCMRQRWLVVLAALGSLFTMGPLAQQAKKGFLPINDEARFEVVVRAPEGASLATTEMLGERVARQVRELPWVEGTLLTVGDDDQRTPNVARIYVRLVDPTVRELDQEEIKSVVRDEILADLPKELRASVADVAAFSGGGFSTAKVQYSVSGPDLAVLTALNERVMQRLREIPGAVDVDSSLVVGKPEIGVYVDRDRAADLGVRVSDVASVLQMLVGGQKVSTYPELGEQYEVRMRAEQKHRSDEDGVRLMSVPSSLLGSVPLTDVITMQDGTGPSVINHFARQRQVTFFANPGTDANEGAIGDEMKRILEEEAPKSGYFVRPVGGAKLMKETAESFVFGLGLAFVFMYLVLAAQFESWLHPITILLSLPLTLPFAIASVLIFDTALDLFSALGIFVLFGVVKKNAILQVDHTNALRRKGMPRTEAILQANKDRLRPILMTTFAFVAGMLPLVTSKGIGAGFSQATSGVVVGGQTLSLLLTLVAVPVAYSLFDDASNLASRFVGLFRRKKPEPPPELPRPPIGEK